LQSLVTNGVSTPEDVDRTYLKVNPGAAMGPMGMIDMVGMNIALNVLTYWGQTRRDEQMLRNAAYIKSNLIEKGRTGTQSGRGSYEYPNPAYRQPGFLEVPDKSAVADIVRRAMPR
jgi:3-hydroxybutyryl-CoA dehydrogenase